MSPLENPAFANGSEPLLEEEFIMDSLGNDSFSGNITEEVVIDESSVETAKLTLSLLRDVFNPIVLRGVTGFLLWWTVTVWFSSAAIGFVYYSYFDGQQAS